MHADLHTHSSSSDGSLSPAQLMAEAAEAGIEMLSITDHDTAAAYALLDNAHLNGGPRLIPGVEFSSRWRKLGIHIVGLNIDPHAESIQTGVAHQLLKRNLRAEIIDQRLSRLGFQGTLEGARKLAGDAVIGRPHFARYLVQSGQIKNEALAFKKHLGQGKSCDIKEDWPEPDEIISWIQQAGGIAVLAHPAKYKLTNLKLEELVNDFTAAGGGAIEVVSGQQDAGLTRRLAKLANRHGLVASCGSDFHMPNQPWARLGAFTPLPDDCTPVWEAW